jgi:hypothetical protein
LLAPVNRLLVKRRFPFLDRQHRVRTKSSAFARNNMLIDLFSLAMRSMSDLLSTRENALICSFDQSVNQEFTLSLDPWRTGLFGNATQWLRVRAAGNVRRPSAATF